MVPLGTHSAAGMPSTCAARSSSSWTVGSRSRTLSPTSADAMAARIVSSGRVTVSERKSSGGSVKVTE